LARIDMQGIAHSYMADPVSDEDFALRELDVRWVNGGAYSLLGPSGCGKTTLLNIISGLVQPSNGKVLFDGKDVTQHAPRDRNIAQIFQFPVIYDTMTVFDNLAFPLRNRKMPEKQVRKRVEETAELLDLMSDLKRRASGLTADIKQIISLGRGLVRSDVSAILLDEPLTVIDPHVKWILRRRLKQIHEQFRLTMIFVTHDQTEALTFADQVVLLHDGQVLQQGTPEELFEKPLHTFVGYFIGNPGMNLMPCKIEGSKAVVEGESIPLPETLARKASQASGKLQFGIRPEFCEPVSKDTEGSFRINVGKVENLGDFQLVTGRVGENKFRAKVSIGERIFKGTEIGFLFPEKYVQIFENERSV
jgi:glycerol transport system ATP-binding protein